MKKILLAAIVAITIFSCTKDETSVDTTPKGQFTFRAEAVSNDGWVDYSPTATVKY